MDRNLSYYLSGRVEGRWLFAQDLERVMASGYIGDTATFDRLNRLIIQARKAWEEEQQTFQ